MPRTASRTARKPRQATLLTKEDFRRHLFEKSAQIAPSDVTALVSQAESIRARLAVDAPGHPRLGQRARIALHLLVDHARGRCPQIPYETISVLAAAMFYYLDPIDVIPDSIPGVGMADDALMLDLAWQRAAEGIDRYLTWKGVPMTHPAPPIARPAPPAATKLPAPAAPTRTAKAPAKAAAKPATKAAARPVAKPVGRPTPAKRSRR